MSHNIGRSQTSKDLVPKQRAMAVKAAVKWPSIDASKKYEMFEVNRNGTGLFASNSTEALKLNIKKIR
jgi:hypothetical protein